MQDKQHRSRQRRRGRYGGEAIWFNGGLISVKAPGEWSDDAFSLCEVCLPRGRATGLHTDPSDETFYILEGELCSTSMARSVRRRWATPSGSAAAFRMRSSPAPSASASSCSTRPGTHDRFFRAGGQPATSRDLASAPPPDLERTMAAAERFGVRFLGPPPFADVGLQSG